MFKVPNQFRLRTGAYGSTNAAGNNGAFIFPNGIRCIVSDGAEWEHVSASLADRIPTWEEMCWVKDTFWSPEDCVVQYHPPKADYVNCHTYTLHLWRPTVAVLPRPPSILVGPKA